MSTTESRGRSEQTAKAPLERLRREFDHLLEVAWSNGEKALDAIGMKGASRPWIPDVDVVESETHVTVSIDLPGVDPAAVDVSLAGNMLTVKGLQTPHVARESEVVHSRERPQGSFVRCVPLPVPVDAEQVSAESRFGTLVVELAKQHSARPRHIRVAVKSAPAGDPHVAT